MEIKEGKTEWAEYKQDSGRSTKMPGEEAGPGPPSSSAAQLVTARDHLGTRADFPQGLLIGFHRCQWVQHHRCHGNKAHVWRHVLPGVGQPFPGTQKRDSKPGLPASLRVLGRQCCLGKRSMLGITPEWQLILGLTGKGMGASVQPC